jgi:hypothetical protein
MKRISLVGLMLGAFLALTALGATSAFAEERTLLLPNRGGVLFRIRSGIGTLTLRGGSRVTCRSDAGEGTSTNGNSGRILILFTECESILETICTGEGDAKGLIHFEGEFRFILALLTERLVAAFVAEFREVKFRCELGAISEAVKVEPGCVAGLAGERSSELNSLVSSIRTLFTQTSNGVQDIQKILLPEARTESECKTEAKIGSGRLEPASQEGRAEISTFVQEGTSLTADFMNPEGA